MSPEPKLKSEELVERINKLTQEDRKNVFKINALRKEAEALIKNDPFNAYMILGALSGIEAKIDEVRDYFNRSIKISPNNYYGYYSFAKALHNNGFYSEASPYAIKANELNPGNTDILNFLVNNCCSSGRYRDANDWLKKWGRAMPKRQHKDANALEQINYFVSDKEINDDDVEHLQLIAFDLLNEYGIFGHNGGVQMLSDEESSWVSHELKIIRPVAEIVDLNEKLAEKLAGENLPSNLTSSVVIMYSSAS